MNGHLLDEPNMKRRTRGSRQTIECRACSLAGIQRFKSKIPLYDVWITMIRRTIDPGFKDWRLYGGKGITVCARWRDSAEAFASDIGRRPSPRHTLDRIDSNGNYCPENCKWSTPKEQARNMSRNVFIEYNGQRLTIAEWAERAGLKYMTVFQRLKRGWTIEAALTFSLGKNDGQPRAGARSTLLPL